MRRHKTLCQHTHTLSATNTLHTQTIHCVRTAFPNTRIQQFPSHSVLCTLHNFRYLFHSHSFVFCLDDPSLAVASTSGLTRNTPLHTPTQFQIPRNLRGESCGLATTFRPVQRAMARLPGGCAALWVAFAVAFAVAASGTAAPLSGPVQAAVYAQSSSFSACPVSCDSCGSEGKVVSSLPRYSPTLVSASPHLDSYVRLSPL